MILSVLLTLAGACQKKAHTDQKYRIAVSVMPQNYFIQRLRPETAVMIMIPSDYSHESYEPLPDQMRTLSQLELYIGLGATMFETHWVPKFQELNPKMKYHNQSVNVNPLVGHHHDEIDNLETSHQMSGKSIDPHYWLSPKRVKRFLPELAKELIGMFPEDSMAVETRLKELLHEIDSIDYTIETKFSAKTKRVFLVFHPAWTYLAEDYGLEQIAIENEGKEPSPTHLAEIIESAKQNKIRAIFAQKQFDQQIAHSLAEELHIQIIALDPLAENWLETIRIMTDKIAESMD